MPMMQLLVVDDSEFIHKLVCAHLDGEPVAVHSAFDGDIGLAAAAALKPDLILLDLDLPAMSGIEVFRRLKADPATANTRVIFLTADRSSLDHPGVSDLGVLEHIAKPFTGEQLRELVRQASLRAA